MSPSELPTDPVDTRFLILARDRSGSNLLALGINAHPLARVFGELFNLEQIAKRPQQYLGNQLIRSFCQQKFAEPVIGLKLMYGQATDSELDKSW